jgi:Common central domain of tyrosinase
VVVRKSVRSLSADERVRYVNAVKTLKSQGKYDTYVETHQNAMGAHRGPAFLPWHREFLLRFERDLQQAMGDGNFGLPYWDWAYDSGLPDPTSGAVWGTDLLGGTGNPVASGPFASWPTWPSGTLNRAFASAVPTLPTQQDVAGALGVTVYDSQPWDTTSNPSFRNQLEGWINGPQLHNRVHLWVGGSMLPMTSPNDPVFFLHHCNIDRIWAQWQARHPDAYLPVSGGPTGHNLNDPMSPWDGSGGGGQTVTPADVLDYGALGYTYVFATGRVSGTFQKSNAVLYNGGSTYQLATEYSAMVISGTMAAPGSVSLDALVPRWNPDAKCGDTQGKSVVIWTSVNGQEIVPLRVHNWQAPAASWQTIGPIELGAGDFTLGLSAGEGDGCGWPESTDPFYVAGVNLALT